MAVKSTNSSISSSTDGVDDPIIVKSGGTDTKNGYAESRWVTITLDTEENMGWKIVKGKGVTAIIISEETAIWNVKTDGKKKIVIECPGKEITGMSVSNMVDKHGDDVPRKQLAKDWKYPEIKILNGK